MIVTSHQVKLHVAAALKNANFPRVVFGKSGKANQPGFDIVQTDCDVRVCYFVVNGSALADVRAMLERYQPHVERALGEEWMVRLVQKTKTAYLCITRN